MEIGEEEGKRRIKLFCPSVSKIVQIIAWDEQKLDLGSIARVFGLDPNTLKLNGHFISRGVDLVASSVTWNSLIGFFSARGLSTGASDSDALLIDGKLSKIGSKRSHDLEDAGNGILNTKEQGYCRDNKKPQREHCSRPVDVTKEYNGPSSKRKLFLEDESHLKKTKSDQTVSGMKQIPGSCNSPLLSFPLIEDIQFCSPGILERKGTTSTNSQLSCSFFSKNMKRMRSDEMVAPSPLKKMR